jgi:hypothetical protein
MASSNRGSVDSLVLGKLPRVAGLALVLLSAACSNPARNTSSKLPVPSQITRALRLSSHSTGYRVSGVLEEWWQPPTGAVLYPPTSTKARTVVRFPTTVRTSPWELLTFSGVAAHGGGSLWLREQFLVVDGKAVSQATAPPFSN